ncbi:MAG: Long-chain-fatty-acid--CoA ligase FadD15 [Myxococcota bacterium]|nr:Long-chain-fatty-acid--CoA ligase FadD15 [Myxococcota bacterium]
MSRYETIGDMLETRAGKTPAAVAYKYKSEGVWKDLTWKDVWERSREIAAGLIALGAERGDRAAILCSTRYEWSVADNAIVMAGMGMVTIYPSSTPDDCWWILFDSGARFVFVENQAQLKKIKDILAISDPEKKITKLRNIIVVDNSGGGGLDIAINFSDLAAKGKEWLSQNTSGLNQRLRETTKDDIACIIYTSGTTGRPKGVVLTHQAFSWGCPRALKSLGIQDGETHLLFLPLAHSFAKMLSAVCIEAGITTAFAESIEKAVDNAGEIHPDFMASVPRIFEKVHTKVVSDVQAAGGLKLSIFNWALETGKQVSGLRQQGREPGGFLAWKYGIAHKLVFSKLHNRFGGRIRFFISGGAPLSPELARFFHAAGLLILEGYGLTETNSISTVNRLQRYKFGTIGLPHDGVEIKIAEEDGEILQRAPCNLREYFNNPAATKDAIDADGWFHTGDIGVMDKDGFIKITDRKKDIIVTAGGKKIAPQNIENQLKMSPYISQVVLHGDKRKFIVALITLDADVMKKWAAENGVSFSKMEELANNDKVRHLIQGEVDKVNKSLASFESIKKFSILPRDLTIDDGELTPSLKVKRNVVSARYKDLLDGMYAGGSGGD